MRGCVAYYFLFIFFLLFSFNKGTAQSNIKNFCGNIDNSYLRVSCHDTICKYPAPFDTNTQIKQYHLQFLVVRDDSGQGNGNITVGDIDYLMTNLNSYFSPWKFSFCYSVQFVNDSTYLSLTTNGKVDSFTVKFVKFEYDQISIAVADIPVLGQSGSPTLIDYSVIQDSSSIGHVVLAHEIGHDFGLYHSSDPNNLMYASCCGVSLLDTAQIKSMHCLASTPELYKYGYPTLLSYGKKVCNNFGLPYARFYSDKEGGCTPLTITFKDSCSFNPTSIFWDFGDGTTNTSANPTHVYTSQGKYTVTLIASNQYGSDTLIKSDYITVNDTTLYIPYQQDFESQQFPPPYSYIENNDNRLTWELFTETNNNKCLRMNGFYDINDIPFQPIDYFITPSINFSYCIAPYMSFRLAYPIDPRFFDTLNIYASTDCFATDILIYSKTNENDATWCKLSHLSLFCYDLVTGALRDTFNLLGTDEDTLTCDYAYTPSDNSHWRIDTIGKPDTVGNDSINLNFLIGQDVAFKFEFIKGGQGNYFYLDDILITADSIGNPPTPSFLADTTLIYVNDTVHFTSTSTYTDSLQWLFVGGKPATSIDTTPAIVYDTTGIFAVTLVASNIFAKDTLTKTSYITVLPKPLPAAGFTADTTKICAGDTIQFTDSSINATIWYWTFQGGNPSTAATQNASVVYADSGKYDVTLSIANAFGADTLIKAGYITVLKCDTIGINEHSTQNGFSISPNPVSNYAVIEYTLTVPQSLAIDVYNVIGKHVLSVVYTNNHPSGKYRLQMNTTALTSGIYFISIHSGNNKAVRKLVKME